MVFVMVFVGKYVVVFGFGCLGCVVGYVLMVGGVIVYVWDDSEKLCNEVEIDGFIVDDLYVVDWVLFLVLVLMLGVLLIYLELYKIV